MNAELDDAALESMLAESLVEPEIKTAAVTEDDFTAVMTEALEAVGGRLLFKSRVQDEDQEQHVAAASVGEGSEFRILLLTQPVDGGALKVEAVAKSDHPLARIAPAYAGLMDVLKAAA
jgi:hypothetical protein